MSLDFIKQKYRLPPQAARWTFPSKQRLGSLVTRPSEIRLLSLQRHRKRQDRLMPQREQRPISFFIMRSEPASGSIVCVAEKKKHQHGLWMVIILPPSSPSLSYGPSSSYIVSIASNGFTSAPVHSRDDLH
jgi:hypothetical protein